MKKKKTQLLLLLTLLMCTAMTCDEFEEDLALPSYPSVLTKVQLHHLDNTGDIPQLPNDQGIKKEAYLMQMELQLTSDVSTDEEKLPEAVPELKDGIVKVSIFTLNPFDAAHSSGSNVDDCFKEYPILLKDHLKDITLQGDTIQICNGNSLYKALTTIPQSGVHKFRIVLTLASGKTLEQDSEPIVLY